MLLNDAYNRIYQSFSQTAVLTPEIQVRINRLLSKKVPLIFLRSTAEEALRQLAAAVGFELRIGKADELDSFLEQTGAKLALTAKYHLDHCQECHEPESVYYLVFIYLMMFYNRISAQEQIDAFIKVATWGITANLPRPPQGQKRQEGAPGPLSGEELREHLLHMPLENFGRFQL